MKATESANVLEVIVGLIVTHRPMGTVLVSVAPALVLAALDLVALALVWRRGFQSCPGSLDARGNG